VQLDLKLVFHVQDYSKFFINIQLSGGTQLATFPACKHNPVLETIALFNLLLAIRSVREVKTGKRNVYKCKLVALNEKVATHEAANITNLGHFLRICLVGHILKGECFKYDTILDLLHLPHSPGHTRSIYFGSSWHNSFENTGQQACKFWQLCGSIDDDLKRNIT
jgi:hypothetical protein